MHVRIILEFFEKRNAQGLLFFSKAPDVSNEPPCLKTTGLYDYILLLITLFHYFCFIFSAPISFMFSNFSNSCFFMFFLKPLTSIVEKLYIYIYISEKAMAPHSSTLAWKIPWMEEPGRLQSMGSLRVGHH